jgi:hypothetical protein
MFKYLIAIACVVAQGNAYLAFGQVVPKDAATSEDDQRLATVKAKLLADADRLAEDRRGREETVSVLMAIVNDESKPGGNKGLVDFALEQLGSYPDSERAVKLLVNELDFQAHNLVNSNPLYAYTAARSLIKVGVPSRRRILGAISSPTSDRKLHVMAVVLAATDQIGDDRFSGPPIAAFRLQRLVEQIESDRVEPEGEEAKATAIRNLRRLIVLLSESGILHKDVPLPGRGQK